MADTAYLTERFLSWTPPVPFDGQGWFPNPPYPEDPDEYCVAVIGLHVPTGRPSITLTRRDDGNDREPSQSQSFWYAGSESEEMSQYSEEEESDEENFCDWQSDSEEEDESADEVSGSTMDEDDGTAESDTVVEAEEAAHDEPKAKAA